MEGSRELRSLLLSSGCAAESSTPAYVRKVFKKLAEDLNPFSPEARAQGTSTGGASRTASLCRENPNARRNCILLLRYCLEDLSASPARGARYSQVRHQGDTRGGDGGGGGGGGGGYGELAGLPLVPLADGSHGVFKITATVDKNNLKLIQGMGFSEARARQALTRHKELAAAVDWLTTGAGDAKQAEERPFVLCTEEEARLLAGAGASIVSEASLAKVSSPSPSAGGSGQGQAGTGAVDDDEDDGRVLRALRSPSLQCTLNVTGMRDDLLPDLIGQTLPAEWRGSGGGGSGGRGGGVFGVSPGVLSETTFPWTPGRAGHPDVDWFRSLWGYLALTRPSAVRLLAESFPVVPTGEAGVCPLSLSSAVIDASGLGGDVRSILVKAGCKTLLPGVFAGGVGDTAVAAAAAPRATPGTAAAAAAAAAAAGDSPVIPAAEGKKAGEAQEVKGQTSSAAPRQLPPPPVELFEYVRSGTRRGVLAALGTAQRSAGKPLAVLMRAADASERDALRGFLARDPVSDLSNVEVAVCRGLPIVPIHEDGLKTALALAKAGPAAAAAAAAAKVKEAAAKASAMKPNGSSRAPDRNASLPATPPGGGSYTHADGGPLYLLLEGGMGLIGVGGRESGDTEGGSTAPAAAPLQWLETHLLTPHFVKGSGDSGAGRPGSAEAALLERLGVELVGRANFFVDHVFPRIKQLPTGLRDAAMVEALLAAPRLSQQHLRFKGELVKLEFIPMGGRVSLGLVVLVWRWALRCACHG